MGLEYPGNRKRLAILEKLCAEERLEAMRGITAKELKYVADRTEDFSPADLRRGVKDDQRAVVPQGEGEEGQAGGGPARDVRGEPAADAGRGRELHEAALPIAGNSLLK